MAASASRGGDAGPSAAQQKVDSKVLWHFGLMPTDGSASSGGVVTRVLHVDAREDRLVEIMDARIVRVIALDDLVSYEEEEDEDEDEDAFSLDEDEAALRARERATVSLRVRRRPFEEVEDIEYRLQSVPDARALRVVLARLSRGRVEDEDAEFFQDVVPGLDARVLRAGTLMRRIGRVALSDAETAAGRGGGRWTTCFALCVPGKLILLAKQPKPRTEGDESGDESGDGAFDPAPAVATGGRASLLSIHFAASLADARVVERAPRWNAGGGGEFDLVFNWGRLVLAAPRGGRRERDAWVQALERAAGKTDRKEDRAEKKQSAEKENDDKRVVSAALDAATRAALAEAKRVAAAMRLDFGEARSVSDEENADDEEEEDKPERVLVLDRFWRRAALGVGAHFLFNFSAEVLQTSTEELRGKQKHKRKKRVLLHVDVERDAVEAYVDGGRGEGRASPGPGSVRLRNFVTRSVETKDVSAEAFGARQLVLRAAGHGSFPRGAVLGRFAFQTSADREVFASLVHDLRCGTYTSADHYQYRALIKRGLETGVPQNEKDAPARFLVLVPGKLLVLRGDQTGVPLATASLAEGAEVTALEKTKRSEENSEEDEKHDASNDVARAVVALTLPNGDAFAFRFATLEVAKSWARGGGRVPSHAPLERRKASRLRTKTRNGKKPTTPIPGRTRRTRRSRRRACPRRRPCRLPPRHKSLTKRTRRRRPGARAPRRRSSSTRRQGGSRTR